MGTVPEPEGTVAIGVAARNEEKTIASVLLDLDQSNWAGSGRVELIVCLNGCTDRTEDRVAEVAPRLRRLTPRIATAPEGLISAQRTIIHEASPEATAIVFVDADVRLPPQTLPKLVSFLMADPSVIVAAARPRVPDRARAPVLYNVLNIRSYTAEAVETPRHHFVGRCFVMRRRAWLEGGLVDVYDVPDGFLAEDIYLSYSVAQRWGLCAIRTLSDAPVYYLPVSRLGDWANKWERIWHDLDRLRTEHPDLAAMSPLFERRVVTDSYQRLPFADRACYTANRLAKRVLRWLYCRRARQDVVWRPARSSKQADHVVRRLR
jgi:cellulose synthase/poly-beta-1,6-N-acetylglucosamine synthase-like glycosyltransferase